MKREKLRRRIALAIFDILHNHKFTLVNVMRYVTSEQLTLYRIRKETKLTTRDYQVALEIAFGVTKIKPSFYRYARRGSPIAQEREQIILSAPIADLIKS